MTEPLAYDREVLVEILVYHWRTDSSGCGCGWAQLGRSHPAHIADVYEDAMTYRDLQDPTSATGGT